MAGIVGGALAATGIVSFYKDTIKTASNLNEIINKSTSVFGDNAAEIMDWSKNSARAFGQSQRGALEAASSFGNMFKQLGITGNEAARMSKQMVELASDFASFHDADPTEVLLAMQSAFRGEYDAVQRFVPVITAATVEQKALELGLAATTKELTAQDKAIATQTLLYENAGDALGDFARTSGSYANLQRTMNAEWDNAKAAIGQAFLPAATAATAWMVSDGIPLFRDLALGIIGFKDAFTETGDSVTQSGIQGKMQELGDKARELFDEWAPRIKDAWEKMMTLGASVWNNRDALAAAIIPLGTFVTLIQALNTIETAALALNTMGGVMPELIKLFPALANPVGIVIALIAALAVGFIWAYKNIEPFRDLVDAVARVIADKAVAAFNFLKDTFETVWPAIKNAVSTALNAIGDAAAKVGGWFAELGRKAMQLWDAIVAALAPLGAWFNTHVVSTLKAGWDFIVALFGLAGTTLGPIWQIFTDLVSGNITLLIAAFQMMWTVVSTVLLAIWAIVSQVLGYLMDIFGIVVAVVMPLWSAMWDQIWNVVSTILTAVKTFIETVLGVIRGIFQILTGLITGDWDKMWEGIRTVASSIFNGIKDTISNVWDGIKDLFKNGIDAIKNSFSGGVDNLLETVKGIPGRITTALGDLGSLLYNAGKDIIQGLIDGIKDMIPSVGGVLEGVSKLIPFKKGPPSKDAILLLDNGRLIMQGLMKGIESQIPALQRQLVGISASVPTLAARTTLGPIRMQAGWETGGAAVGAGGGITNVVNVTNPIPTGEDISDALGWAARRMGRV